MEFSENGLYLGILHQKIKFRDSTPNYFDHRPLLLVWDLSANELIMDFDNMSRT